ncbi:MULTISPECIES: transporter substrate-binding domain-containing protein [Cytobacillus]|uniref:transporter substrate-binding domain-containing protein n=1 Tax=Cytobacillus TaxID=2675230 RepID=UPI00203AD241|nr:transporter substrate-binding domain-containing protein [Cytobacillus firmus]MCM3706370.1 transporter substrate-binding domain-containing protein [Cytobacillus firmus]URM32701.1 transporter substrate-binding domain-containing protein [Cytobacillus firmus]
MLIKKSRLLSILLLALMVILAGCGSDSSSGKAEGSGNMVEKIKEKEILTVAMGGKYPPFNYINDKNELDGFDVDISKEIAKRLGVEFKPVTTEWDAIITGLLTKKYDIILGSLSITDERKEKVDFVHYYTSGGAIIVPENSKINKGKDLDGVTVGVGLGTTFEEKAIELGADVKTYSAGADAFTDMGNGRLEAVISDKLMSAYAIKTKGYPYKIADESLFVDEVGIAIRKDNPELTEEIQKIIDEMKEDGTYTEISEKWFGIDIR